MISKSSSAAVRDNLRMPKSSMISKGTVTRHSMCCLRVPSFGGFGEFIEQGMGLAVEHTIALLDGGLSDGLGKMTLPAAG